MNVYEKNNMVILEDSKQILILSIYLNVVNVLDG